MRGIASAVIPRGSVKDCRRVSLVLSPLYALWGERRVGFVVAVDELRRAARIRVRLARAGW